MLQYIITPQQGRSALQMAQAALEGGCRWFEIYMPDATDEEVKAQAEECIPLCRDNEAFLVIYSHPKVVEELRVSGIRVATTLDAAMMRVKLGPHAIVGVHESDPERIIDLHGRDIDYTTIDSHSIDELAMVMSRLSEREVHIPVVATGVTMDNLEQVLGTGVNGVAMSDAITDADDPTAFVASVLARLGRYMER